MKATVNRAELLLYLSETDTETLASIADCFGYQYQPKPRQIKEYSGIVDVVSPAAEGRSEGFASTTKTSSTRPTERFCLLKEITQSELVPAVEEGKEIPPPDFMKQVEALDLNAKTRNDTEPPKQQPLVAWSKLWPVIRAILSENQQKKRPDLKKLVKTLAQGHNPRRIPQLQKQGWTANLRILIDRPQRLRLFNDDYLALLENLKKMRGETGLEVELLDDLPGGQVFLQTASGSRKRRWQMPEPETPLLILSDLGIYESSGNLQRQWLEFGRRLRAAACTVYVLAPVPAHYFCTEQIGFYRCISWDRGSALRVVNSAASMNAVRQRRDEDALLLKRFLEWLSALVEIEPEILRSVRHHFTERDLLLDKLADNRPLSVALEALVWNHKDIVRNSCYVSFASGKAEVYRAQLQKQALKGKAQLQGFYQLLKRAHAHKFLLVFYEELNFLSQLAGCEDDLSKEAERRLQGFVKALSLEENKGHLGLLHHGGVLLQRQPADFKRGQVLWSSLWGMVKARSQLAADFEGWQDMQAASAFLNQPQALQSLRVLQFGESLYMGTESALEDLRNEDLALPVFELARFEAARSLLVAECFAEGQRVSLQHEQLLDGRLLGWPFADENPSGLEDLTGLFLRLHLNGLAYGFEFLLKPDWATGIGRDADGLFVTVPWVDEPRLYWQNPVADKGGFWGGHAFLGVDEYGLYADLDISGVVQRFRWIQAKTFMMGSPESEIGRDDDEDLHQVTLTQGFWLADTAVTQALWLAVMGENPSRFSNDLNNPVEKVSWDDAQIFIEKINAQLPEIQASLPTEAQWEYACRAGTQTPFSFGDNITPEQVNYWGDAPYANGKKGLNRKKTIAVKSLPASQWGLYEMHGNVWEWCRDGWQARLGTQAVTDLLQSVNQSGPGRVVRGGSWNGDGRYVRSACRGSYVADNRDSNLGLRLSLGLQAKQAQVK